MNRPGGRPTRRRTSSTAEAEVYSYQVRLNYQRLYGKDIRSILGPIRYDRLVRDFRHHRVNPMDAARAFHETEVL